MEKKAKILIVDDEPEFIAGLQAALEGKGYDLVSAGNKEQAQETVQWEKPDLIILGTIVPRGDAFSLQEWLKQGPAYSNLPLIVIDAPLEKRLIKGWIMQEGLQLKAEEYLSKPIEPVVLVPKIGKLLDKVTRRIRVLVVDDHSVVREGIRALLNMQDDMEVVGEALDGKDAIEKVHQLTPDVTLMDIIMPVMNGLEATSQISDEGLPTKVLILTQYDDEENMFVAKQVGAYGFIAKKAASSDLMTGIRAVGEGRYFPKAFAYVSAN